MFTLLTLSPAWEFSPSTRSAVKVVSDYNQESFSCDVCDDCMVEFVARSVRAAFAVSFVCTEFFFRFGIIESGEAPIFQNTETTKIKYPL